MKSAYTEFTILMFLFSLSKIPAAPLLSQDTFTYIGNSFYSNTSHVRTELSAPLLGDIVGFCSRNCFRDLACYGFELCTLSGGNEICRLTNGVAMGSFDFTAGEICKHYYMNHACGTGMVPNKLTGVCQALNVQGHVAGIYSGCSDCACVALSSSVSGMYSITLDGGLVDVQCVMKNGYAYTVIMDRNDGSVDFYRTYSDYEVGFGSPSTETWIGNKYIHLLTTGGNTVLRFEFEDFSSNTRYAEYSSFNVQSATTNYLMTVSGYTGNAGDSMTYHNNAPFSAKDVDHDTNAGNCAVDYKTAWWNLSCLRTKLTATYGSSGTNVMGWHGWESYKPLKVVKMLLRHP
ncbi:fibrinogen-like protein A [Ostrea edulis]|uniref:fibrinogen-like protein A n=1 Tax=Ostrea edulis TaxID=37623 RepID=UPI0024AED943|nr:fibrinogen-like protein A [Ostrea edulis]